ncbi:MAG TPA: acetyl-CoA hydrolase/transferase C-terminal domain-containing protein [Candidatus Eisenbacteria bacterium]|nr:acetyl-CoA hydrolase/transferase C-terminal domain-containing protein [Candidatus Eisenbacteria bacterium]
MPPRNLSLSDAIGLLCPRDTLALGFGPAEPTPLLEVLSVREDWTDLLVYGGLLSQPFEIFTKPGVRFRSIFMGAAERTLRDAGCDVQFVPGDFRRFAKALRRVNPRVLATSATPPDRSGWMSLGLVAAEQADELHRYARDPERLLVVLTNPLLPWTMGLPPEHPHGIHVDEVDVIVEAAWEPIENRELEPNDAERRMAEHALRFIHDGCTLQTGIGTVPAIVADALAAGSGGDYGIHSELFTPGLMKLHEAGKVTNRKGQFDGLSIATFAQGNQALYRWLDGQQAVRFLPVRIVNDPSVIARNRQMVSINGALGVDLKGQLVADQLATGQYSGIGGHEDFVTGASLCRDGHSLICLPSTARLRDGRRTSKIVTSIPRGIAVTTPRHQVDVVITEWGAAELAGRTERERAELLVAIAHPAVREALRAGATDLLEVPDGES